MGSHVQVMCINAAPLSHSLLLLLPNIRHLRKDLTISILNLRYSTLSTRTEIPNRVSAMLKSLKATLGDRSYFNGRTSTSSSNADISTIYESPAKARVKALGTNDIQIRLGKPPYTRFVQTPGSTLKACPVLRARLVQGCRDAGS